MVVYGLRLCASSARNVSSIPGQRTKVSHAAWCGQKKKKRQDKLLCLKSLRIFSVWLCHQLHILLSSLISFRWDHF